MSEPEQRYGFIGLIVPRANAQGQAIQKVLSEYADQILGRMGLPHLEDGRLSIITLIVKGTPEEMSAISGRLGRLEGVIVKSAMAPPLDMEPRP